jgi:hypothetical protein
MFERTPWLLRVWETPSKETRIVMDNPMSSADFGVKGKAETKQGPADALPLRTDDTLAVFTYKLQRVVGAPVYWWAEDPSGEERCPYMVEGGSAREPMRPGIEFSDTLSDLYETHLTTNVLNVMRVDTVVQLNPELEDKLRQDPCASVDPVALSDAEEVLADPTAYAMSQTSKVVTYTARAASTHAAVHGDAKTFSKALLAPPFVLFGLRTSYDVNSVRVSEQAIVKGDLSIDDAYTMAGHLVRAASRRAPLLMVATVINSITCETLVEEDVLHTVVKSDVSDLAAAQEAVVEAQGAVHGLRRTRQLGDWMGTTLHMTTTFDSVMMKRSGLLKALQRMGSVLYFEPQEDGSVVVHLKRVPRFVATDGRLQFLDMYAYMLDEGQFEELSRMLSQEFALDRDIARGQVSEYVQMRELVAETRTTTTHGTRALTPTGAMAVLKATNRGLRAVLRCEGDVRFAHRLMWLIARVRPHDEGKKVSIEIAGVEEPSDSVQAALLRVRNMDASAAKSEVPVGTPSMYIIDRLNAHDPVRFQYKGAVGTTYARQCGAVDQRQPIAISDAALKKLRETMSADEVPHTLQLGEGGTHYMCPELWCRKLQRPMTRAEAGANNGKCADGEEPLDLGVSSYWAGVEKRHPGVLAIEKHPLGMHAPCCFKNLKGMMVERLQACEEAGQCAPGTLEQEHLVQGAATESYKMTGSTVPLPQGREGTLPLDMPKWAFGRSYRVGVVQDFDPVSNAVCHALRLPRHELLQRVGALGVLRVARIARGNLLRRFIDQTEHLHDPDVAAAYRAFTLTAAGRRYAEQVGEPDSLRDFALWNGYRNLMEYMVRGRARSHLFVAPVLMAALEINIIVLEYAAATGVSIHCPYGGSEDSGPTRVVVLKQGDVYEPLVNISEQGLQRLGTLAASVCRAAPDTYVGRNMALVRELEGHEGLRVEKQVVSMSFETVGVVASGLFVPYLTPSPCDLELPMVFTSALPTSAAARWTSKSVGALFRRLGKKGWYSEHEVLEHGKSVTVHVGQHFVPVRASDTMLRLARTNLTLFAAAPAETDDRLPSLQRRQALARTHDLMTTHLVTKHPEAMYVVTHPLCPLVLEQRLDLLMDLTSSISGIEEGVHALACSRLVSGQYMHAKTHKNHRNEIIADEQDVIDGTFLYMMQSLRDGYGNIAIVRTVMREGFVKGSSVVFTQTGTCPKSWRTVVSGMQILMSEAPGLEGLVSVVQELGGPKLDTDTFEDIVAKEYLKSFDTRKAGQQSRRREVIFTKLRKSDSPAREARRLAEGVTPDALIAAAVLSMCDVNVLAVDRQGKVVRRHASTTDRYVACFEQVGGHLAFLSMSGSRILTKGQMPAALAARFDHGGPTL